MRIIDYKNNTTIDSILIMLTPSEASEMVSKIESLDPGSGDHVHINDIDYKREITIAIYSEQNPHFFSDKIQNLISD